MSENPTSYSQALEDDEVDVCRVCRSGAPEDGELYWPCQCSGSMRFVHETCLNEWIAARGSDPSPKCEVCHTPLAFTKIFPDDMPSRLPLHLLAQHVAQSLAYAVVFVLRALLVAAAWLVILPYAVVWIFRSILFTADSLGSAILLIAGRAPQELTDTSNSRRVGNALKLVKSAVESKALEELKEGLLANVTAISINWTTGERSVVLDTTAEALFKAENALRTHAAMDVSPNPIGNLSAFADWQHAVAQGGEKEMWQTVLGTVASDAFKGQIITSVVFVIFVVCFLLREWIVMHVPRPELPELAAPVAQHEAEEIARVVADLQARANQAVQDTPAAAALQHEELADVVGESVQRYELLASQHQQEQEALEQRLREAGNITSEPLAEERPVASTSRLELGQSPSPFDVGEDHSGPSWVDLSDEEVESALLPSRARGGFSRPRADEGEEEGMAGPTRSGARGSPEATRRRREERSQREERACRRAARESSAEPSFPMAPPSPDRPIRALPARRVMSGTPRKTLDHSDEEADTHEEDNDDEDEDETEQWNTPAGRAVAGLPPPQFYRQLGQPPPQARQPPLGPPPLLHAAAFVAPPLLFDEQGQEAFVDGEDPFVEDVFDDLGGVLETIGLRGPLQTLVQNLGLMILLISLCLAGGVWLPLCIGRVLAAAHAHSLVTMPLRAVRTISDPLFDALFSLVAAIPKFLLRQAAPRLAPVCAALASPFAQACTKAFGPVSVSLAANATEPVVALNSTLAGNGAAGLTEVARPAAVTLLKKTLDAIAYHWTHMATDDDPLHRGLCIALGYGAALLAGVWYLQFTQSESAQQVNRMIREGITQQLVLLKVCLFIFIEIILFPGTCGALLNLATLPLFPQATIAGRLAFHVRAPISAFFISWVTGTAFMFAFASAIDMVRLVVRPGLIWFIRDPQAAEFHPIREILERSSSTQMRKIATSAMLYGAVIALTFGVNILFLRHACIGILPLRWPAGRSFTLPIDLIVYHFVVPASMRLADPQARIRKLLVSWTKRTAHALRLSSFVFGLRDPEEECTHLRRTWHARLTLKRASIEEDEQEDVDVALVSAREVTFRRDGGFARVPAVDTVKVAPKRPMIVAVTEEGHALTDTGSAVIAAQLVEMATTRSGDAYRVVYVPPNFGVRIFTFVYLMWFSGSLALCGSFVAPLLVGRYLFGLVTHGEVHDIYSLAVGVYVLSALSYLAHHRSAVLLPRITREHARAVASIATFTTLVGVVLPTLVSLVAIAFVQLPLSLLSAPTAPTASTASPPTIYLLHLWATGTVGVSVLYRLTHYFLPHPHPIRTALEAARIHLQSPTLVNLGTAARILNTYLVTYTSRLVLAILAPYSWAVTWSSVVLGEGGGGHRIAPTERVIAAAYAVACAGGLGWIASSKGKRLAQAWAQRKLEESFMLEKRLRNFEKVRETVDRTTVRWAL